MVILAVSPQSTYGRLLLPGSLPSSGTVQQSLPALLHPLRCVPRVALCTYPCTHTHPFSSFTSSPRVQMYPWVTEGSAPDDLTAIEPNMKHQKAASCESWGPSQLKPNWSDTHIWGFIHFHSGFQAIVVLRCRSLTDIQTLKRYIKIYIVMWKVWVNNTQITELS